MSKIKCPFPKCLHLSENEITTRKHLANHDPELIYDFAFDNKLLPGDIGDHTTRVGTMFHYVLNQIMDMTTQPSEVLNKEVDI